MPHALVTGGAGFIGSHLSRALLEKGYRVRVFDNFSTGKKENLLGIENQVEIVKGDLADDQALLQAVRGIDTIFHLGAIPSVPRSLENPRQTHQANVVGTFNLLLAARPYPIKRLVYSSSSSVYGNKAILPKEESMLPEPLSPYAASKLAGEYDCSVFHSVYGTPTVSLRYFNVFGPRQDPNSLYAAVIPKFITQLLQGKPATIYGDGLQTRDFTYVQDVIRANLLAAEAGPEILGKIYNIAGGKSVSLLELLAEIENTLGFHIPPLFEPSRKGEVRDSLASIERAKSDLKYMPRFSLREGLKETIAWFSSGLGKENGKFLQRKGA
ncbi:MAG: SDR family oxidoreductase [Chlamydiae bacterium]|nr:SDR family oxidoreductase [Chlamydiota bacterium]MBI3277192.1 SDR family oxidoreductase [Chlamydiota bacterium]